MSKFITKSSLAVLAATSLCTWHSAVAQRTRTEYQGTQTFVELMPAGRQWTTGNPGNLIVHIRNRPELFVDETDDPRMSGETLLIANANLRVRLPEGFFGPAWGTIRITNLDGSWEGTWVARISGFRITTQAVLRGLGEYEGLQARATYDGNALGTRAINGVINELP
jgi:hypothetical protein